MSTFAFFLIIFSSLMHALYNLLVKRSRNKTVFIWWMFVSSTALFTVTLPFLPAPPPKTDYIVIFLATGGACCFVLYHLCIARAYQSGELSMTYPLTQTSILYVPLWGIWLLDEQLSLIGGGGILCILAGVYVIQLQRITLKGMLRPFGNLRNQSVQAAMAAGFVYSIGAIFDKTGVQHYSPLYFTYLLVVIMLALMSANLLRPCHRNEIVAEWRKNRLLILASGPLMMGSFLSFRYGLAHAQMSYAVPVRQVSVLLGVLIGVIFLGEACGRIRFLAALLILTGATLIRLG